MWVQSYSTGVFIRHHILTLHFTCADTIIIINCYLIETPRWTFPNFGWSEDAKAVDALEFVEFEASTGLRFTLLQIKSSRVMIITTWKWSLQWFEWKVMPAPRIIVHCLKVFGGVFHLIWVVGRCSWHDAGPVVDIERMFFHLNFMNIRFLDLHIHYINFMNPLALCLFSLPTITLSSTFIHCRFSFVIYFHWDFSNGNSYISSVIGLTSM